jgi:hypothetical protein
VAPGYISATFQLLPTLASVPCPSVPTPNALVATIMLRLRFSSIMSSFPLGLPYTSAESVDACARVNRSSFSSVHSPQLLLSFTLSMAPQHKQKIHKTSFTAVPTLQSRASSSPHSCRICDRAYATANALEQHYRDTPVHPKCTRCNIGFADNAAIQAVSSYLMLITHVG